MKRRDAINAIVFAGWHNDQKAFVRLYTENRIALAVAREAFARGRAMAERGEFLCTCSACKNNGL